MDFIRECSYISLSKRITFRVIIAGSRGFKDYSLLSRKMYKLLQNKYGLVNIQIVSGGAQGADKLGEYFAERMNFGLVRFPADWEKHGKAAGMIRNKQMAEYANALVAFWDGLSKGTANMIEEMKKLNKPVRVIKPLLINSFSSSIGD